MGTEWTSHSKGREEQTDPLWEQFRRKHSSNTWTCSRHSSEARAMQGSETDKAPSKCRLLAVHLCFKAGCVVNALTGNICSWIVPCCCGLLPHSLVSVYVQGATWEQKGENGNRTSLKTSPHYVSTHRAEGFVPAGLVSFLRIQHTNNAYSARVSFQHVYLLRNYVFSSSSPLVPSWVTCICC